MSPRKTSNAGGSNGSSPLSSPGRGNKGASSSSVLSFNLGTSALQHASPRGLASAAAPGSPVHGSPTPAPTPSDAAAAPSTHSVRFAPGSQPSALPSPLASSTTAATTPGSKGGLWSLLGHKLPTDSAVHEAARQGDLPLIQALMVQSKGIVNAPGDGSVTPLMLAAGAGHSEVVTFLVKDAKADVAAQDLKKRTALHHLALGPAGGKASDRAAVRAITACLLRGRVSAAVVNARDEEGLTALHHAAIRGVPELVRVLLKHGADARMTVAVAGQQETEEEEGAGPMDARRLCEEQCRGVPLTQKREVLRLLEVRCFVFVCFLYRHHR
jgi:hypothetical protein